MAHSVRTEEGFTLRAQFVALHRFREAASTPSAALILATDGGMAQESFDAINGAYAGFVAGLAQSIGLTPDQYVTCIGRPVMACNINESVVKSFRGLLASSSGVRACSSCEELFFVNSTSNNAARLCNGCRARSERDKKRRQRGTDLSPRDCTCCGVTFTPARSNASCCSGKCRAKLSRQRHAHAAT